MPKTTDQLEKKIALAALRLIAAQGWKAVTLDHIIRAAKVPAAAAKKQFASKNDVLAAVIRTVSAETAALVGKPDLRTSPRDRLFEVMMARFDILQKHRKAILNITTETRHDSTMLCAILPAQGQAMRQILALAGLGQGMGQQSIAAAGLEVVYLATFYAWSHDETLDMAKTMAALDRYLRWGSTLAETIFRAH